MPSVAYEASLPKLADVTLARRQDRLVEVLAGAGVVVVVREHPALFVTYAVAVAELGPIGAIAVTVCVPAGRRRCIEPGRS